MQMQTSHIITKDDGLSYHKCDHNSATYKCIIYINIISIHSSIW